MREVPIYFSCEINGERFDMKGHLDLSDGKGFCIATPEFDRKSMPPGFQPELMSYTAITGYPNESYVVGNATNPFSDPNANFKTIRTLDLGDHGTLHTEYYSENRGTENEAIHFHVKGDVSVEQRIVSIAPISEVWRPGEAPHQFIGEMTFTWMLEDGDAITAYAKSTYEIESSNPLHSEQLRIITFDLDTSVDYFKQSEIIRLYDMAEWSTALPSLMNDRDMSSGQ